LWVFAFRAGREVYLERRRRKAQQREQRFHSENHIKNPFLANRMRFFISIIGSFILHFVLSVANNVKFYRKNYRI